jgi:preprotein translocase subunit SecG
MLYILALFCFLIFSLLLCTIVLAQESRATGIGAAFGAETATSLFGGSSADILKKITGWCAVTFLALCLFFSAWTSARSKQKLIAYEAQPKSSYYQS